MKRDSGVNTPETLQPLNIQIDYVIYASRTEIKHFRVSMQDFAVFILLVKVSCFPKCALWIARLSRCSVRKKACDQIILGTHYIILTMLISIQKF